MLIAIKYKCACMTEEASVTVIDRDATKDVVVWLEKVVKPAVGRDHKKRSPKCRNTKTEYVKLPLGRDGMVGKKDMSN